MSWNTGFDRKNALVEKECPELKEDKPKPIKLNIKVFGKIYSLLKKYPEFEWGVYMIGEETEEAFEIEDILLMKQEVTGAVVEFMEEKEFPDKCIGWLHSHAQNPVFLSDEDLKTALLYKLTVVVNNELKFLSKFKKKLSCGKMGLVSTELIIDSVEIDTSNITEKNYFIDRDYFGYRTEIKTTETLDKKKYCVVCGQRLGKKKVLCPVCGNYVHLKCFDTNYNQCINCVNDMYNNKAMDDDEEDEDKDDLSYRSKDYYERDDIRPWEDY